MKRSAFFNWNTLLAVILLLALVIFSTYSAAQQGQEPEYPPGSIYSNQPDGARALKLWLDELGYQTSSLEGGSSAPTWETEMLFILRPSYSFTKVDVNFLDRWVRNGGTLIYAAADSFTEANLLNLFELDLAYIDQPANNLSLTQPLLINPPVSSVTVDTFIAWRVSPTESVTHLQSSGFPILVSWRHGMGQVFAITALNPFTNAGLKEPGNAALVYNLALAGAGDRRTVAFDEYHHGVQQQPTIGNWLASTRVGWAILYSAAIVFVFLLIGGKRFGTPVPLPEHAARRTTAEYIRAMANLKRRAGRRQAVLAHYKDRLKRHLGRACGVDPSLDDGAFLSQLTVCRPDLDKGRLARLLANLSRSQVSERDMVRLAEETTQWLT